MKSSTGIKTPKYAGRSGRAARGSRDNGGIKAVHLTYVCLPLFLLLIAGAVFLLHHGVDLEQGGLGLRRESLKAFAASSGSFPNTVISYVLDHLRPSQSSSSSSSSLSSSSSSLGSEVGAVPPPPPPPTIPTRLTTALASPPATATSVNATTGGSVPNPTQNSKYAYVTLISGIDSSFKYRGFLYNTLIMKKSLADAGSLADFIALIGFSETDTRPFEEDMNLLRSKGIITYVLPRLVHDSHKLSFAEMALLKITPWSFTQYRKIQFFDGDVMPTRNMDCFFLLGTNTFTIGAVSPLNSGWYLAIPDTKAYEYMLAKATWRLERDWDKETGWSSKDPHLPAGLTVRGGSPCAKQWDFNGADMDQGLLTHYYVLNHGNVILVDTNLRTATKYATGLLHGEGKSVPVGKALDCCNGGVPTAFFSHFTGRQKPWMVENIGSLEPVKKNADLIRWCNMLDSLDLPVNSKTIGQLGLGSPLGFWNANFPKGGMKRAGKKGPEKGEKKGLRGGKKK